MIGWQQIQGSKKTLFRQTVEMFENLLGQGGLKARCTQRNCLILTLTTVSYTAVKRGLLERFLGDVTILEALEQISRPPFLLFPWFDAT